MPPSLSSSVSMAAFIIAEVEMLCSLLRAVMSVLRASRSPMRAEYIKSSIASKERVGVVAMVFVALFLSPSLCWKMGLGGGCWRWDVSRGIV